LKYEALEIVEVGGPLKEKCIQLLGTPLKAEGIYTFQLLLGAPLKAK